MRNIWYDLKLMKYICICMQGYICTFIIEKEKRVDMYVCMYQLMLSLMVFTEEEFDLVEND